MRNNIKKVKRNPSIIEAYSTILFMLLVIGVGNGYLGMDLKMMLIICTVFNMFMAYSCHATWNDIQDGIVKKITSMGTCFYILLGIGFLVSTFIMSGTLPVLVSWLAALISPKYVILLSFVLVGILSLAIGSSFAAMGTLGVVMFSVASVQGLPAGISAAAVICGAWLGQYISPVADIVNCAASANKISVNQYMKDMAAPLGISVAITIIFFFIMGLRYGTASTEAMSGVQGFINDVKANFNSSALVMIPLVLAIVLSILQVNTVTVLFGSGFVALIFGIIMQDFNFHGCINAAYSGFSTDIFYAGIEMTNELSNLLNRGGIFSMADPVLFLLCALACVGTLDVIGVFDVVQKTLFRNVKSAGKLNVISMICILLFGLCTADPYPPAIVGADLLNKPFAEAGYDPRKAAIISQTGGLLTTMSLPWSFCAWYSGNVYGVTLGQYFPYAILFWLVPVVVVVLSLLGIGNPKLKENAAM
ncbi:MAG TPA: hypothetical protein DIW17_07705 [Clostridiales bacterium]|jgi:NhaC family Na+:H+ antiporter|nr:hypothetical protein [Clostridiales bacterium]